MSITRWNPLSLIRPGGREPRLFGWSVPSDLFEMPVFKEWPSMDIYSEGEDLVVKVELPGVRPEDVNIQAEKDHLTISGKHAREEKVEEKDYYYRERFAGSFSRVIPLPKEVAEEDVKAEMKDGLLTVRVKGVGSAITGTKKIPIEEK